MTLGFTLRTIHATKSAMLDRTSETSVSRPAPAALPVAGAAVTAMPVAGDLVSELLMGMRLVGIDYRRIELDAPFRYSFGDGDNRAKFVFVARGGISMRAPGGTLHRLSSGDVALLPRGGLHVISSSEDVAQPCRDLSTLNASPLCRMVSEIKACDERATPRQERTLLFSACMDFDLGSMHPLVGMMPEVMRVDTLTDRYPEVLPMLEAMAREAECARAGSAGILSRLADVVAACIVRAWVECGCGDASGWIAALRDPRLGRVLLALHRDPGRNWTLADLAREMGASRSVFAERFLAVTGVTPLRYLTEMRMRLAAEWMSQDAMPIESVALKLGYGSLPAFSRAFKRVTGYPPSRTPVAAASSAI